MFYGVVDGNLKSPWCRGFVLMYDSLPIVYALHPEIFTVKKGTIQVEISGELTYGQTVCDVRPTVPEEKRLHSVVLDIDRDSYLKIVTDILENSDY